MNQFRWHLFCPQGIIEVFNHYLLQSVEKNTLGLPVIFKVTPDGRYGSIETHTLNNEGILEISNID